jgi:hypothetical protein
VSAALAEHLSDEEATIVPAMEHVLTQSEENWFSKHGRAATPKGQLLARALTRRSSSASASPSPQRSSLPC